MDIKNAPTEPKSISLEKKPISLKAKRPDVRDQLQQASEMYEKHFLSEMLKAMRSSVNKSDLMPESMGEKIYSQELDGEYVKSWVTRGGIGLSKMIYEQMAQRFGIPTEQGKSIPFGRSQGDVFKIQQKPEDNPKKIRFDIESKDPNASLSLPWDGKVQAWVPNPSSSGGNLLINHKNEFQSVWSLPKKPNLIMNQDLAAGNDFIESFGSEKLGLEIRSLLPS